MPAPADPVATPLRAIGLRRSYTAGDDQVQAVADISLELSAGEIVAITGPSGSGKSTLLSLLAGLEAPDAGEVWLLGQPLHSLSEDRRAILRRSAVGFIFQSFNLIPALSLAENAALPLILDGVAESAWGPRVAAALSAVGLAHRAKHYPDQTSTGERQRTAIARALVSAPPVLFADEPTGSLDSARGAEIMALLEARRDQASTAILLVTHDPIIAARADRVLTLVDGRLQEPVLRP